MKSFALPLVIIGALNWGLVGLFGLNIVSAILGTNTLLEKVVYILIGVAALWMAYEQWGKGKK